MFRDFLGEVSFIVTINKCCSTSTYVMPFRRHIAEGCKQTINVQVQPNHEELDERPLSGICGINIYIYLEKKKKRQRIVWNFFLKLCVIQIQPKQ